MEISEGTGADAMDARIDKRLSLLQDSLELRLTKAMEVQLKSRFETAVKILGWAFGLVALVFTLFGIKTAVDLREAAKNTAIDEVKKKLAIDDPNSDFRRDVDRVIARGLINSYFLEIARNKGNLFAPDVSISDVDVRRLIDLARDARSEDRDFRDAVDVLLRSNQIKEDGYLERILVALGNASDEHYKWMQDQPEKRATLLELFTGDKLATAARSIVSDEKNEKRLTIAATNYLAKVHDKDAIRSLEKLATKPDEDVSRAAVHALARLSPDSKAVVSALTLKPDASADTIAEALRLTADVARPSSRGFLDEDPQMDIRLALSTKVVAEAIQRGYVFRLSSDFTSRKTGIATSSRENMSTSYGLPSRMIVGHGASVFAQLLQKAPDEKQTKLLLRALCLENDERCHGVVHVALSGSGQVRLASGLLIGSKDAPAGVYLRAQSPAPTAEILASWTDQDAVRKTLVLDRIVNPKDLTFEIRSIRSIADVDTDEE
ncbi:MAG: hypothetical protein JNN30_06965 [Rhodanobacteraceae bacterium]|nr:hypothetical protein [Rhodanobacteraceae bacterium]